MIQIFADALKAEGGTTKLAKALGAKPNDVTNWKTRGVPRGYVLAMQLMYGQKPKRKSVSANHRDGSH